VVPCAPAGCAWTPPACSTRYTGPDDVRERCEALVRTVTATASDVERAAIRQVAEALIAKAEQRAVAPV
jgi:hypothetical protein